MKIDHLAILAEDIELLLKFYTTYFDGVSSEKYYNPDKGFTSYFLTFESGSRIELMNIAGKSGRNENSVGLAHLAFATGCRDEVKRLTERLRADGYRILGEPRITGDGYYEAVIADPEGNIVEITV